MLTLSLFRGMSENSQSVSAVIRFGPFDADLQTQELRKHGVRLRLPRQSFQILKMLLERPGSLITREELRQVLWPSDTFVDFDHSLNAAVNRLREVLGDSADERRLVETLPRRGYRFIGEIALPATTPEPPGATQVSTFPGASEVLPSADTRIRRSALRYSIMSFAVALLAGAVLFLTYGKLHRVAPQKQRALTRVTFDKGLQFGATWSPDGRFVAYSSDRAGKFDIWVQQVSGGDPVQITKGPGHNWQPEWSPDGKYIAYRSEDGDGGLFVIPALGGMGLARKIVSGGFYPRWSPDSTQILFQSTANTGENQFYVANLDGSQPREIVTRFSQHPLPARSAAWHPDGKRISVWVMGEGPVPTFWTVPVVGGEGVESEIDPQIIRQLADVSANLDDQMGRDAKFSWMPSGKAVIFERTFRGVRNLWKMSVDPETLRAYAIERLTVGSGLDTDFALSADGRKVAFTAESDRVQAWIFPFDGIHGRLTGAGAAVTSPGEEAWQTNLSRDGKKLVFNALRAGKWELREQSQMDGDTPVVADDSNYGRRTPVWSPDGKRLAYVREKTGVNGQQLVIWSAEGRTEQPLTPLSDVDMWVTDWSSDGKQLLLSQETSDQFIQISTLPAIPHPNSETLPRIIAAKDAHYLWQAHFSPDGQWVAFLDESGHFTRFESIVYITRATGGPWIRVTDGKFWVDKPRWAPDGKTIYFLSRQSGFYDVWGIRFDLARGKTVGDSFRVTDFGSPTLMIPNDMGTVEFSLTQDKLMLPLTETSGSIWVLNDVDR
jgi:Tol biopolymer transport system component/DNA-binding winged helix-turn-helix (wHTH) protein